MSDMMTSLSNSPYNYCATQADEFSLETVYQCVAEFNNLNIS